MRTLAYFIVLVIIMSFFMPQYSTTESVDAGNKEYETEKQKVIAKYATTKEAYHAAVVKPAAPSVKPTVNTAESSKWHHEETISPIDDSKTVTAYIEADEPVPNQLGMPVYPLLVFRCNKNKTEAYIKWDRFITLHDPKVTTRINKQHAVKRRWTASTDGTGTFAPSGYSFARRLLGHNGELIVQTMPYASTHITTVFDINGFDEAIQPIRSACHW